jgi:hypothetical protein
MKECNCSNKKLMVQEYTYCELQQIEKRRAALVQDKLNRINRDRAAGIDRAVDGARLI